MSKNTFSRPVYAEPQRSLNSKANLLCPAHGLHAKRAPAALLRGDSWGLGSSHEEKQEPKSLARHGEGPQMYLRGGGGVRPAQKNRRELLPKQGAHETRRPPAKGRQSKLPFPGSALNCQ